MLWVELNELARERISIRLRIDIGGHPSVSSKHDGGRLPGRAQHNERSAFADPLSAFGDERQSDGAQRWSTDAVLLALSRRLQDRWRTKQVNSFTRDGRVAPSFSHLAAFGLKVLS
jgi:hypothetical protein